MSASVLSGNFLTLKEFFGLFGIALDGGYDSRCEAARSLVFADAAEKEAPVPESHEGDSRSPGTDGG